MIADSSSPVRRRRWGIAWLLGLGVLVNYCDRVNLSVAHDALYTAFGISTVTFGYLSGAYNWTYALCQLPIGVLLDKFGIRRVGAIGTFLWSVASFGAAITPGLSGFFAARFLLGVGEAPTFPANAKAVGYWFPRSERSMATALFDGAAKLAPALGVPLLGILLIKLGWRLSFALTGVISLLYFLLFWSVYRDPKDDAKLTEAELAYINAGRSAEDGGKAVPLGYLLRQRKVIGVALGMGSYNYVFYLLLSWLPTYLSTALGLNILNSFLYTGVPWLVATVANLSIGGWMVDALIARGWDASKVRRSVLIVGTACGIGILGAAGAHSAGRALFWISLSIGGLSAASPVGWSMPSLIAPGNSAGKVGGIINFSNQMSGIAAPILTGYLVAASHGSYRLAFAVPAVYLLIGIAGYYFLLGRVEQIPEAPAEA